MAQVAEGSEVDRLQKTKQWAEIERNYSQREWRLDNLYSIVDERGSTIKFVRNEAQRAYMRNRWSRDAIAKARQLGFSTLIEILILDTCLWRENITSGIIDAKLDDAENKLKKITFAYDRLPEPIRWKNPLLKRNEGELIFANGSSVTASTSYRGGTPQILHVSEYGRTSVDRPDAARQIKNGSMQAVHATGWIACESTAHGTAGEFYEMCKRADALQKTGRPLTALDYRLHFYGWWLKPEYRVPNNLIVISHELREYFGEVNAKLTQRGVKPLDADQMAWYAQKLSELGRDDMFEEFPTVYEETFFNSIEGAFWKREISRARQDKRIGYPVPFDPSRRVETWWDIGEDCTAILFVQTDGVRYRFIDYWEEEGGSIQGAATILDEKAKDRGFRYERHVGPHDVAHREWGNHGKTRYQSAIDAGVKFEIVPQVDNKSDSIDTARAIINMAWFDEEHCKLLVERIENYRKKWNKTLGVYSSEHVHDMSSHPADALQQGAMYHTSPLADRGPRRDRSRPRPEPRRGSQWSS